MRRLTWLVLVLGLNADSDGSGRPDMDTADLIGTWDDITPERERVGYQVKRPEVVVTFEVSTCTWEERGGGKFRQSLFIPVEAGEHRGLDFMTVNSGAFWTTRALFKVDGGTLTVKEAALEQLRPTDLVAEDFTGGAGENWAPVRVYRRRAPLGGPAQNPPPARMTLMETLSEWMYPGSNMLGGASMRYGGDPSFEDIICQTVLTTPDPFEKVVAFYADKVATARGTGGQDARQEIEKADGKPVSTQDDSEGRPVALRVIVVSKADTTTTLVISRANDEQATHIAWSFHRRFEDAGK